MFCRRKLDPEKRQSQEIDRYIKEDLNRKSHIKQLLLLGTGESGKTTIIKQMKILHINGYSKSEKLEKVQFIKQNIRESIYDLIDNMGKIDPPEKLKNPENQSSADYILKFGKDGPCDYSEEFFDNVAKLWSDPGVKATFQRSNEFQLIDSAGHFLDRLEDVRKSDYVPSTEDILFCRIKTTAISKIEFSVPVPAKYGGGTAEFWMFDVGGQRGERKKWIAVFEGIQAILFLIAASGFDQTLREDNEKNRLKEALELFEDIFWSRFVRKAGMIAFLNKQDLLRKKIESGKKFENYFPDYKSFVPKNEIPRNEYEKVRLYMKKLLMDVTKRKPKPESVGLIPGVHIQNEIPDRDLYVHYTVATDTTNIKLVFESVRDIILTNIVETQLF